MPIDKGKTTIRSRGPGGREGETPMTARCDLHVHSKHSNRPSEWILRRLGSPESFMEPAEVYRRCKRRGMRFVTISDHDVIDGALEIAHHPDAFVSCEVTAELPEDHCEIHCLVWGIDEARHREIQALRGNLYELRDYLYDQGIAHAVAHPLYRVNDRLTLDHFEKLLVLFKRFEGRNGIHDGGSNRTVEAIAGALTPEVIFDLAERHGIDPRDPEPWVKRLTGGSDDHGGLYVATTWTETPEAATVADYLERLRRGDHRPGGAAGSALRLTQSLYTIAWEDFRRRYPMPWQRHHPFARLLRRLAKSGEAEAPRRQPHLSTVVSIPVSRNGAGAEAGLTPAGPAERRSLALAGEAASAAVHRLLRGGVRGMRLGDPGAAAGAISALGPMLAGAAPYLVALFTQYKDAALVRTAAGRFAPGAAAGPARKAWLVDGLDQVHGVARTVRETAAAAVAQGRDLVVVSCGGGGAPEAFRARRFAPVMELPLPAYETQTLALPPALEVLDFLERGGFGEVVVSAPGPMGLLGAAGARLLGLPLTAIYHTDFPLYARHLTGSARLEDATAGFMGFFYGLADRVLVRSEAYRGRLVEYGVDPERIALLPHGVDRERFRPGRRDPAFWARRGLGEGFIFLYAGRLSREKRLDLLIDAFERFRAGGRRAGLAIAGDGPLAGELAARCRGLPVRLTGNLDGDELAAAYASADAFVFPSTTDTLGNAVLEAQASGLPALVTDRGGPREIVARRRSGVIAPAEPEPFAEAMARLYDDAALRAALRRRALQGSSADGWPAVAAALWGEHGHRETVERREEESAALAEAV
jgi:glycosyltransferase involved in cell wall biosynthesis